MSEEIIPCPYVLNPWAKAGDIKKVCFIVYQYRGPRAYYDYIKFENGEPVKCTRHQGIYRALDTPTAEKD